MNNQPCSPARERVSPRRQTGSVHVVQDRASSTGFTLIEILVTIAIMAVLAALLFPTLGSARKAAGGAKCLGNLRQIGLAFRGYIEDHNGYAPPHWGNPFFDPAGAGQNFLWTGHVAPYLGADNPATALLPPVFDCPNDPDLRNRTPNRGFISTSANWMISYGYNYVPLSTQDGWRSGNASYPNLRMVRNMTTLILAADSSPVSQGGTLMALINSSGILTPQSGVDFRHLGRFNAVALDGHVQTIERAESSNSGYWLPMY